MQVTSTSTKFPTLSESAPPSSETHTQKKVKEVAKKPLKEPKNKDCCKKFFARLSKSFCDCIKKIISCLRTFFCFCCLDEDSSGYDKSSDLDISLSDPLDEMEDFFQEIYKGKVPPEIEQKIEGLGLKKAKKPEHFLTELENKFKDLQKSAQNLAARLSVLKTPSTFKLQPQVNIGNSCYMNSVLQCLENSYGVDPEECFPLLSQDLSMKKGETIEDFENRLLKLWAPIPVINEKLKAELSSQLLNKIQECLALKETAPELFERCKKEVIDLKKTLRNPEDRILFKWSYLILLQAKFKGDDKRITEALLLHRTVCMELAHHGDFEANPTEQKDAASYLEYWNDMMGVVECPVATQRVSLYENKTILYSDILVFPEPILQIEMSESKDLIELIGKKFLEKKTAENKEPCDFTLPDGQVISKRAYNVIAGISSNPPKFLTFHFKRFVSGWINGVPFQRKEGKDLPIHLTDLKPLDFSPFFRPTSLKGKKALYELTSFVVHEGGLHGGHYYNYVKREGKWYHCNDTPLFVKEVNEVDLPLKNAYMITFRALSK